MFHSPSRRARARRRRTRGIHTLAFALSTAALVTGLQAGPVGAAAAAASASCSWHVQWGLGGLSAAAPDTDAAYWTTTYSQFSGHGLTISGAFPTARYMSFTLYASGTPVSGGELYDAEIQPSSGVNPFQSGNSGSGGYTLHVVAGPAPNDPAADTLYTGTSAAAKLTLVYRLYDPTELPTGGVPLPQITDTIDGLPTTVHPPCVDEPAAAAGPSPAVAADAYGRGPAAAAPASDERRRVSSATPEPTWEAGGLPGNYPNPDNAYLVAHINANDGQLVVVQAEMPAFPDTNAGAAPWQSGQQVRYWSICQNDGALYTATGCAADFATVENAGVATFVISSPANRPPNATTADGVNWLPWGAAAAGMLIYRQMLAAPTFAESIRSATGAGTGTLASAMGPYFPQIAYCSEATFAAAGASGCLAAAAPSA